MKEKEQISIFIVEDVEESALLLKSEIESTFGNTDIKVETFKDGEEEFKKAFKDKKPQIVILDYNLNSNNSKAANGIEVLKWIKKENESTNVIMLTVEENLPIKPGLHSIKNGASDYIVKTGDVNRAISFSLASLFRLLEAENETIKAKDETKKAKKAIIKTKIFLWVFLSLFLGLLAVVLLLLNNN